MKQPSIMSDADLEKAEKSGKYGFTPEFFLYYIDKFFAKELNIVLYSLDDEYDRHIREMQKTEDEFQKQMNELDDFFLEEEPENQEKPITDEKTQESPVNQSIDSENVVRRHLEKTIQEFEQTLSENKFNTPEDKYELEHLVSTLKVKLNHLNKKGQSTTKSNYGGTTMSPEKTILDIHELRRRGLQEIFNFYARQHIPLNRKFEEL